MKHVYTGIAFVAVCLCCGMGARGNALASASQGKRYMGSAKEAFAKWQKSLQDRDAEGSFDAPLEAEEPLTMDTFPDFHARWLKTLFAVGADGRVVQIGAYGSNGRPRRQASAPTGAKPATAKQCWETLTEDTAFVIPVKVTRPCTFCDGERWVIYFPEEVTETKTFQRKYHSAHDGYKQKNGYRRYDEGERQEQAELSARATEHGWEGPLCTDERHLLTLESSGRSSYHFNDNYLGHVCWGCRYGLLSCCWAKVHESPLKRWRHPCPVCKGKAVETSTRFRRYRVGK